MSHILVSSLSLLLLFAGAWTRSLAPQKESATQTGTWSLKLIISGGFPGVGAGNLEVSSEGNFNHQMPGQPNLRKGCEGTLRERQLQAITEAVAQSKPNEWNLGDLKDPPSDDAFSYKLELRIGSDRQTSVQWNDNMKDKLPPDLKRLSNLMRETMRTATCYPPVP